MMASFNNGDTRDKFCKYCSKHFLSSDEFKAHCLVCPEEKSANLGQLSPNKYEMCSKSSAAENEQKENEDKSAEDSMSLSISFDAISKETYLGNLSSSILPHLSRKKINSGLLSDSDETSESVENFSSLEESKIFQQFYNSQYLNQLHIPPFACKLCTTRFTNYTSFRRHLRVHIDGRCHMCEVCGKQFYRRYLLNQHRMKEHAKRVQGLWQCHLCEVKLNELGKLEKHFQHVHCASKRCRLNDKEIDNLIKKVSVGTDDNDTVVCSGDSNVNDTKISPLTVTNKQTNSSEENENTEDLKKNSSDNEKSQKSSSHDANKECFVCEICGRVFLRINAFLQHKRTHSLKKAYVCHYCCRSFCGAKSLAVHKKRKHRFNQQHVCYVCGLTASNFPLLKAHVLKHSKQPKKFEKAKNLDLKDDVKEESDNNKTTSDLDSVKNAGYCKFCRKIFLNINNYKRHMQFHKSSMQCFSCTVCGKLSSSLPEHKKHVLSHSSGQLNCQKCKAVFHTENILKEHEKGCSGNALFKSNIDLTPTRRSARLMNKVKTKVKIKEHKEIKKLIIPKIIEKSSSHPFVCSICSRPFKNKDSYRRHNRMHLNMFRHSCEYCGKYFFRKDHLRQHESGVHAKHKATLFHCFYCKINCGNSESLKEHVTKVHKKPPISPSTSSGFTHEKLSKTCKKIFKKCSPNSKNESFSLGENKGNLHSQESGLQHSNFNVVDNTLRSNSLREASAQILTNPDGNLINTKQNIDSSNKNRHVLVIGQGEEANNATEKPKSGDGGQTYKCGRCSISFKSLQGILDHFRDVHGVVKINKDNQSTQEQSKNESGSNCHNTGHDNKNSLKPTRKEFPQHSDGLKDASENDANNEEFLKRIKTFESTDYALNSNEDNVQSEDLQSGLYKRCSHCNKQFRSVSSLINHICEQPVIPPLQPDACSYCFKKFENKAALAAHEKLTHILIDWFQCLVCSTSGPKEKMKEHMLTHMYKVGSFVADDHETNFEYICPFLPGTIQRKNPKVKVSNPSSEENTAVPKENSASFQSSFFHPMKKVFCKSCNRIFIYLSVLLRHKCVARKSGRGPFPCCIARCSSQLATKGDLIAHIKAIHYHPGTGDASSENSSQKLPTDVNESSVKKGKTIWENHASEVKKNESTDTLEQDCEQMEQLQKGKDECEEIMVEPSFDVFADVMEYDEGECSLSSPKKSLPQKDKYPVGIKPPAYSIIEIDEQAMYKCEDCVQIFTTNSDWLNHCRQHAEGNLQ